MIATYRQVWTIWRRTRDGIAVLNTLIDDPTLDDQDAANWVLNRIVRASLPNHVDLGGSRAIDSTDVEPWARTRGDAEQGGRWTKDREVFEGHSPAKNGEPGRVRFLSELLLSVAIPEEDGPSIPEVITGGYLGRANVDRSRAALYLVDDERAHGGDVNEVVADRGYSGLQEENFALPLHRRGIDKTIDLRGDQRGPRQPFRGAISRDGSLFCPSLPDGLKDLPAHLPNAPRHNAEELAARYDERQPYAFRVRQSANVTNGGFRMECPARAGHVRCPLVPASVRLPYTKPGATPPDDPPPCCTQATITVPNEHNVRIRQKHPYGTTKWKAAYNRRPHVESANSLIKTHFAAVRRGYMHVFGLAAQALLLAFTLAAANLEKLDTYRYRKAA
jgi:hypothetical protein